MRLASCAKCGQEFGRTTCQKRCPPCQAEAALELKRAQYQKHKHKLAERHKVRYSDNPDRFRGYHYKHRYGVTAEQVRDMHAAQGGCCAICNGSVPITGAKRTELAAVDHCHATMKVRGLLCRACNLMIGNAKDSPLVLRRAAAYLEAQ